MGLFSTPLALFFTGEGTTVVLTSGEVASFGGAGALVCGRDTAGPASRDFDKIKEPGSPTSGFSSIYSLP